VSERLSDEPLEPEFDPGLPRRRSEHGGMLRRDDDEFALAAERDRVAAGLEDYAPDDVPPAADAPPPGVSEAVDLAERGLLGAPQSTRRTADSAVPAWRCPCLDTSDGGNSAQIRIEVHPPKEPDGEHYNAKLAGEAR
jgi:hypothetical protein